MSNAGKIADAKAKLAKGLYDNDPARAEVVRKNIKRWKTADTKAARRSTPAPEPAVAEEPKPAGHSLPTPSRAAAKLLKERGFTVADMVASEAGTTGKKVTINEVRHFLAAQDG